VSRRGTLLGEAGPGSLVGLEALLSQDRLGLGVVAATDALALFPASPMKQALEETVEFCICRSN